MPPNPTIAVIGSGYWGKNLVRNYHQLGALRLICDRNETLIGQFKEQYPDVEICLAYNDLLTRPDIDAVAIATPAETHFTLAREALLAGKHVYVEKPLVLEEREAVELIDLADLESRVLMVGHLLQYHPVFIRLKELANSGELGRIDYIYSNRLNLGKIRREENILWSFAPHDISMILALAGEEPETVFATGANYLHKKIADVTTTHMEFSCGTGGDPPVGAVEERMRPFSRLRRNRPDFTTKSTKGHEGWNSMSYRTSNVTKLKTGIKRFVL